MQKGNIYQSIKRMLFFYSSIILATVFIVVAIFAVRQNYKEYEVYAQNKIFDLAESINRDLYLTINKSSNIVNNTEILKGLQKDYEDDITAVMEFYNVLEQYYSEQVDLSININPKILIYPENKTMPGGEHVIRPEDCENPGIIESMRAENDLFIWDEYEVKNSVYIESVPLKYISLYRNIFSFSSYLGCLEMRIERSELERYLKNPGIEKNEKIFIVNSKELNEILENKNLSVYQEELLCGYTVVFTRAKTAFYADFLSIILMYLIIFALFLFVINIISKITVDSITSEIYDFLDSICDDKSMLTQKNTQEVILIKEKFFELIEKERIASENLLKLDRKKRTLEIEMLQNRINPHLLYNSLSAIKWRLIRKKDFEFASLMDALSNYYRIVLNKGNSIITIENELNMIKEYVRINRFLQENEFEFRIIAGENVLKKHIFKLLLQPVVENSIKHGIANRENGIITLEIDEFMGDILFKVTDNGYGMNKETLDKILHNADVSPQSGGYGLYNTQKRIKNCYGEKYGITITSKEGEGTAVVIKTADLPFDELQKRISI